MLAKRTDLGSIPFGLGIAKQDLVKGRVVKLDTKTNEVDYATKDDEAFGFCTYRIEVPEGGDVKDHDTIPEGKRPVVYTLVNGNIWLTTEVEGIDQLKKGDVLTVGAEGKLKKGTAAEGEAPLFTVNEVENVGSYPAVSVLIQK